MQAKDGKWYKMSIQPYRTLDNVIEGAVITFFGISEMKKLEEELRKIQTAMQAKIDRR